MNGEGATPTFQSILEKPLKQLTEDDISQVTREDCRRFLKLKGMRRPSWNKSQAIQQVISLKALLEPDHDHLQPAVVLHHPPPLPPPPPPHPNRECATSGSVEQMTIFYCGKVNVYDGVSPDKARAIMQLAGSQLHFPQDHPLNTNAPLSPSPSPSHLPLHTTILHLPQSDKMVEYPPQYRERGSIARDTEKALASNGNSSRSSTSSPPQPRLPPHLPDNQLKVALPIDLNDKVVEE